MYRYFYGIINDTYDISKHTYLIKPYSSLLKDKNMFDIKIIDNKEIILDDGHKRVLIQDNFTVNQLIRILNNVKNQKQNVKRSGMAEKPELFKNKCVWRINKRKNTLVWYNKNTNSKSKIKSIVIEVPESILEPIRRKFKDYYDVRIDLCNKRFITEDGVKRRTKQMTNLADMLVKYVDLMIKHGLYRINE